MDKQDELAAIVCIARLGVVLPSAAIIVPSERDVRIAAAVRSFMGSNEVVERMARASFSFRHQGDIADPERTWDAPEKSEHPLYWQQKMEHNHPHYRAMARAALSAAIGEDPNAKP